MTQYFIIGQIVLFAIGVAAFFHPHLVFKRSAIAATSAIIFPFIVAFTVGPFLGDGAGMGIAIILYVFSATVLLVAFAASLGAAARLVWMAVCD